MSLFGPGFDNDPFFGGHRSIMSQMDQMMSSIMRDPFQNDPFFGGGGGGAMAALTAPPPAAAAAATGALVPRQHPHPHHQRQHRRASDPFTALGIPSIANMMSSIPQQGQMSQGGNCHMYSSSSVMTMSTGPDGRPLVYQASSSSRGVPGGVQETRRTVNDSRTGTRKMAIGHHIGERSHIIEREQQSAGDTEERQEFINLDENEADGFNREFERRTQGMSGHSHSALQYHHNTAAAPQRRQAHRDSAYSRTPHSLPAITSSGRYRSRSRPMLSISGGSR